MRQCRLMSEPTSDLDAAYKAWHRYEVQKMNEARTSGDEEEAERRRELVNDVRNQRLELDEQDS